MGVTIRDVAKAAGVSITTVSKVFNGYTDVKPATRKKVLEIAERIDYTPNMAARILSSKKQQTIALILNELILTKKSTIPMEVLNGVYRYTETTDYEFVFYGITTEKQKQKSLAQFCREHSISGVVIQGLHLLEPYYAEITKTDIPTVLIDMVAENPCVGSVSTDNVQAAKDATLYLIQHNHVTIGMINGSKHAQVSIFREEGYRQALSEHQLTEHYIKYADYDEDCAYKMTIELLTEHPTITALFCASDLMAIGAMRAVKELGKQVPKDISIVGFDDILLASYVQPGLTTIAQNMDEVGFQAAKLLAERLENQTDEPNRVVPHALIERESVTKRKK